MALLDSLTDDQLALIGCFAALVVSFGIMSLTWTVRQAALPQRDTKPLAQPQRLPQTAAAQQRERKAA
jgi:hypothetical protein